MAKRIINPPDVGPTLGVYKNCIRAGNTVYISGQVAWDADGAVIGPGDIETQAKHIFGSLDRLLKEAGASYADVVETTTYATSIAYRTTFLGIRKQVGLNWMANTFAVVQNLVVPGTLLEIEAKAVVDTPKEYIESPHLWSGRNGLISHAVRAGDTIYVAGQFSWDKDRNVIGPGDIEKQADVTYESVCRALEAAGAMPSDVVKTVTYMTNPLYRQAINGARQRHGFNRSTNTSLVVPSLGFPELLVEVKAIAVVGTPKQIVDPPDVPPSDVYVNAIRAGNTIYVAGQVARDRDRNVVGLGDPAKQAARAFENLGKVLEAAGATVDDVVSSNQYYTNVLYRPAITEARKRFGLTNSTNTSVVVPSLAAPELLLEVEAIAVVDD